MIWTVAKNDFRLLWVTPVGYLAAAVFVFIFGILYAGQLLSLHRVPEVDIGALVTTLPVVLVLLVPILTMRSFSEERRNNTEMLYRASPISPWRVVTGKFLAVALMFVVMLCASAVYPLFTYLLGGNVDAKAWFCYLGLLGLGLAYIAVGIAFSSATGSQFVAAIATFLALFFMQGLGHSFALVAGKSVSALVRAGSLNTATPERIEAVRQAVTGFLLWMNPASKLALFNKGIFRLTPIIFFTTFVAVFLALACLMLKRRYKARARDTGLFLAAVCVAAAGNWLLDRAWDGALRWDVTTEKVFSLSQESRQLLAGIDDPILIWGLFDLDADSGENDTVLFVDQYRRFGDGMITVRYANPEKDRELVTLAGLPADLDLTGAYYAVVNEKSKRYRLIRAGDLFAQRRDRGGEAMQLLSAEQSFTGAVHGLQSANAIPVLYSRGQGEEKKRPLFQTLFSLLSAAGCEANPVDLALGQDIPPGTRLLIMLDPETDIDEASAERIEKYLRGGGALLTLTGFKPASRPNLDRLAARFGIDITNNRLMETHDELLFADDPFSFVVVSPESDITPGVQSLLAIMPREIRATEPVPAGLQLENLLQSSNGAVAQPDAMASAASAPGLHTLGVAAELPGRKTARLAILGSADAFTDAVLGGMGSYSGTHRRFLTQLTAWLMDSEDKGLSIHAKGIPNYYLVLTSGKRGLAYFSVYFGVLVLPALLLSAAVAVHWRRRRM